MSSRVEQARDRNLSRNLVAPLGSSCLHQALYARHAIDAGSLCSIDSVSSCPSLLRQTSVTVQRFPRHFFLTLVKSDRWHPQGYWCSNGDVENDVIGADSVGL